MDALLSGPILPLANTILVAAFTIMLFRQYSQRRKAHQLAWAIGFAMWAAATGMELASVLNGAWPDLLYRFYIVMTAGLVPVLGYGEIRLLTKKKAWAWGYAIINIALMAVFTYGVFTVHLVPSALESAAAASYAALGPKGTFPRLLSAFVSIPAALVLLYGPILSIFRFVKKSEYAYRVWANVLIAAATMVIAYAGSRSALGYSAGFFYGLEFVAEILFVVGFLMAGTLAKGAGAIKERMQTDAAADKPHEEASA